MTRDREAEALEQVAWVDVAGFAPAELELKEEWGEDQAAFAEQDGRVEGGAGAQEDDEWAAGDDFAVSPGKGDGAVEEGVASAFGVVEPQDGVGDGFVPDAALAAAPEQQEA